VAKENQRSPECTVSPQGSNSDTISLTTSREDSIQANCCSAGTPLPLVSWEFCPANSVDCTSLTNATQSVAELKLTGSDLREGDGFVRCVQGCSGAGTQRNAVPANSFEPERRSGKYC